MTTTKKIMDRVAQRTRRTPEALYQRMLMRLLQSIEIAMMAKGMSQTDLADKINMKQPQLSAILSGKNSPTLGTIARIAFALDEEELLQFPLHSQKNDELQKTKRKATSSLTHTT